MLIKSNLEHNLRNMDGYISANGDVKVRRITDAAGRECAVVFCDSITDKELLERSVIQQMQQSVLTGGILQACKTAVAGAEIMCADDTDDAETAIAQGNALLLVQGMQGGVTVETRKLASRSVQEPALDKTVLGARDGFTEGIKDNISLIRRRLRTKELCVITVCAGQSKTRCAILYYRQAEDDARLLERRLKALDCKAVLTVGDLRPVFANGKTLFPTVRTAERPDTVCSLIVKGKVALLLDGQPFALCAPITLSELYEASNDAAVAPPLGRVMMGLRMISSFFAVVLPGLYVSLLTYNRELLPQELVEIILGAEARVPLPLAAEVFIVDMLVLIIFEVGFSLPSAIGGTIGIFGSILLGQALVDGRITSEITLFIVVTAAISGYTIPNYPLSSTVKLLRNGVLLLSALFGLAGLGIGVLLLAARLFALKSLNKPLINIPIYKKPLPYVTVDMLKEKKGA